MYKTSRLDRLSLWGPGLKAGLAAIAAAFMLSTLSPVSAQQPTPEAPPVVEAPGTPPADAAAPPTDAPAPEVVVEEEVVAEEAAPVELTVDKATLETGDKVRVMLRVHDAELQPAVAN